jgi:hypothetical protein
MRFSSCEPMTTVLALFRDRRDAEAAIRALNTAQFDSARLGLVQVGDADLPPFGLSAPAGVVGGAIGCALIGMVAGATGAGVVPGVPAWLPGGWLVPLVLGLAGAGTGMMAGLLMSRSGSGRGGRFDEDAVGPGRTLVTVHAPPGRAEQARHILLGQGAFDAAPVGAPIRKAG